MATARGRRPPRAARRRTAPDLVGRRRLPQLEVVGELLAVVLPEAAAEVGGVVEGAEADHLLHLRGERAGQVEWHLERERLLWYALVTQVEAVRPSVAAGDHACAAVVLAELAEGDQEVH